MIKRNIKNSGPALKWVRNYAELKSLKAKSLQYCEFGEPMKVLQLMEDTLKPPKCSEVLVKVLAAPINPSDVNTIQGKYPIKPKKLPAVAGNEFVGDVMCIGEKVKSLSVGDRVIAATTGLGAWTTLGLYEEKSLMKIPKTIGIAEAATLTVNPCTAYRLLKDFVKLKPGDTIILNGANGGVGQAIMQLCRAWKICSVGIVRKRPNICEVKEQLKCSGASEILTEEEAQKTKLFSSNQMKRPKLALNCVGGKSAMQLARLLDAKGVMVTYGGMSMQPVMVGTGPFIFADICCRGFWVTRWMQQNSGSDERMKMFCDLFELIEKGTFTAADHMMVALDDFKEGAASALCIKEVGFSDKKIIFNMSC